MTTKRPSGARSETVRCENCGEYYSVTYKRCPFCVEDEPTRIFRQPPAPAAPPSRRTLPVEESDEYEELLSRRPAKRETPPPPRRTPRVVEDDEEPPRRAPRRRDEDDDYETSRRRASRRRDEDEDDDDDYEPRSRRGDGGKRLVTNARGGGYRHRGPSPLQIIGAILSLALVAVAAYVVFLIVKPLFSKGDPAVTPPPPSQSATVMPSPTPALTDQPSLAPSDVPASTPPAAGTTTPPPVVTSVPSGQTATSFHLGKTEFTLSDQYPTYQFKPTFAPEGSSGSITWHSSKPNIISVDENGLVTGMAQGVATITASMAGGYTRECMVRSTLGGAPGTQPSTAPSTAPSTSATPPAIPSAGTSAAPSVAPSTAPSPSPSAAAKLTLNVALGVDGKTYDFSLNGADDVWTLKVKNATGAVSWSVQDSSIASIDQNGKVAAVSTGSTKITATVDGQTLECLVRVKV